MNDQLNPHALPFMPMDAPSMRRPWDHPYNYNENMPPLPPPLPSFMPHAPPPQAPHASHGPPPGLHGSHGFGGPPWNAFNAPPHPPPPPPPPPHFQPPRFFTSNQNGYNEHVPQEQTRLDGPPWAQFGHSDFHSQNQNQPFGPPFMHHQHNNNNHHHHHHQQQQQQHQHQNQHYPPRQHPLTHPRPFGQHYQAGYSHHAHHAAMRQVRLPQSATNEDLQAPTQPVKKSKKAKAKAKAQAAANGDDTQDNSLPTKGQKKGKYGDEKIMLPAPQPTDLYLAQASEEPSTVSPSAHVLVILDLNGTVLHRPNKNAKTMIARPHLRSFLHYLFKNFKVMVWSSAKPVNVKALVEQALDKELRSMLVATWARDTFGLSATNYNQNVQVYKNLRLIWSRDQIQQHHPKYAAGERFGQHNTILIDDSVLKASAQPHNLLEIPEFEATPEQMEGDVLREVAGYLEVVRQQADVSRFIKREPFKADGQHSYEWPAEVASGGGADKKAKLSLKGKGKNKPPVAPLIDMTDSLSAVTLGVPVQQEP